MKTPATPWLRVEGLATLVAAVIAYRYFHLPWFWFAVLFFAPDLSMLGYLGGPRTGAIAYNLVHTHAVSLSLLGLGLLTGQRTLLGLGLILCAHIGFDRAMGYGLKLPDGFNHTHLGPVGSAKAK
jgi:hypothetical protein